MAMQHPGGEVDMPVDPPADPIETLFTYHAPTYEQQEKYVSLREAAKAFARTIINCCDSGPDRSAALRKVREAVMTANASIATNNAAVHVR